MREGLSVSEAGQGGGQLSGAADAGESSWSEHGG